MKGVDGNEIVEYRFSVNVITVEGYYILQCSSFTLQNTGNTLVTIDGNFVMKGGQVLSLSVTNQNEFIAQRIKIQFGAGATPKLEIIEMLPNHPDLAHYVMNKKAL